MTFKHEIRQENKRQIDKLLTHFEYHDTPKNKIDKPFTVTEDCSKTYARKILNQVLVHIKEHLKRLNYIRGLTAEERWKNYKIMDIKGLKEQQMYKDAHRRLMHDWKFEKQKKKKKKKKSGSSGKGKEK